MNNFLIGRIRRSISRWRRAQGGIRELVRFDDRMLADIGIARSQSTARFAMDGSARARAGEREIAVHER